jgi:uncharacterized protein (TIGR02118 family)
MVKLIVLCKRRADLSHEGFVRHWKHVHARLAQEDRNFWGRVRGYVQNYCLQPDGTSARDRWDGVVELWFDSREELDAAFSGEETKRILVADLQNFVDVNSMITVATDENVILTPRRELLARA